MDHCICRLSSTEGSPECLRLWRDGNSEPYLHFLNLANEAAYTFPPLLGTFVLSGGEGRPEWQPLAGLGGVRIYFPILGLMVLVLVPGFACIGRTPSANKKEAGQEGEENESSRLSPRHWLIFAIFSVTTFSISSCWMFGQQVPLYAAYSHLHLSSAEGSQLSLIFYVACITCKVLAIAFSTKVPASKTVLAFLALYVISCTYVLLRGTSLTLTELRVCVAVAGFGYGPLYAAKLVVYTSRTPLTPRMYSLVYFGLVTGVKLLSLVTGLMVEAYPNVIFLSGVLAALAAVLIALLTAYKTRIKEWLNDRGSHK